jgi:LTXXQ motif family protein
MLKGVIGLLAFLVVAGFSLAYAQESPPPVPSQTNFKVLTDARIGIVKAALQLTPEQEKLWPPVEEAIRARAEARYNRMVAVAGKLGQQHEVDPVELMRGRADALAQRAANLKKLADAWAPLYQTLSIPTRKSGCAFSRGVCFVN